MRSELRNAFYIRLLDMNDKTFQSRFYYDQQKIENLARDIQRFGQREPIGIRENPNKAGLFQIIYGFQRVKAVTLLGHDTIKAEVYKDIILRECQELSVRDNEMHGDLTEIEKALTCRRLKQEGWTIQELCESFNTRKSTIYNWLKVTELDDTTLGLIHHGYLSVYHGLELTGVENSRRLEALKYILGRGWSVRDVKRWLNGEDPIMMVGVRGWMPVCPFDLKWKPIEDCEECQHYGGKKEGENGRIKILCKGLSAANHPKPVVDFLYKLYRLGSRE